jgi:NhaA family Na+:H+ antiporter
VAIGGEWREALFNANVAGIAAGLVLGKPIGIALACWLAVRSGLCRLPGDIGWPHVIGAGMLGGIGFTMSIFIANLAFAATPGAIDASKLAILAASLAAGIGGFAWLAAAARTPATRTPAAD